MSRLPTKASRAPLRKNEGRSFQFSRCHIKECLSSCTSLANDPSSQHAPPLPLHRFSDLLDAVATRKKGLDDDTDQSAKDINPLFAHATGVLGAFKSFVQSLNRTGVSAKEGPLKSIWRILEKTGASLNCLQIMDVVRAMVTCDSCELMAGIIDDIFEHGDVRVVCLWTNIDNPKRAPGSWFDVKLICYLEVDDNEHKCEVQIVHKKMLMAREDLGGHDKYAETRALRMFLNKSAKEGSGSLGAAETKSG